MLEQVSSINSVNIFDWSEEKLRNVDIEITHGKIKSIVDSDEVSRKYLIPGFINTHSHVAMWRFKGLLDDMNLEGFLDKTFKLDRERSREDIYHNSVAAIYEMLMNGVTSFMDLYYSEDIIGEAVSKMGIRGFLSWVTLDRDKTTQSGDPLENAESFIESFKENNQYEMVYPSIGIQGVYVSSMENMELASQISNRYGCTLHMHLAETRKEVYEYMDSNRKRPALDLLEHNIINERTNMAHCVWLTKEEIEKIGRVKGNVSWNSVSNHKLGVGGVPAIPELMQAGANIGIGTDSNGSNNSLNILETAKNGTIAIKNNRWDASIIRSGEIFKMLTEWGGRSTGMKNLGKIEIGAPADFLVVNADHYSLNQSKNANFINDVIYSMSPSAIQDIIINGNYVKKNFQIDKDIESEYKKSVQWIRNNF